MNTFLLLCAKEARQLLIYLPLAAVIGGIAFRPRMFLPVDDFLILHKIRIGEINEVLVVDKVKMSVIHGYLRKKPHPSRMGQTFELDLL